MSKSDDIRNTLKRMETPQNAQIFWAKVTAVDLGKETCTINLLSTGLEIDEVLLSIKKSGLVIIPKVDSQVLVCSIQNNKSLAYIISVESADIFKVRYNEEIVFGDGSFGGLVKIEQLTTKLNELKDSLNNFISVFNSHIHITTATVGATTAPGTIAPVTSPATNAESFNKGDYENEKITHG